MTHKSDRHDTDPRELTLIRAGQHLWALYKKECGKSRMVSESGPFWEALQTVWAAKRELRKELAAARAIKAQACRAAFARLKAA